MDALTSLARTAALAGALLAVVLGLPQTGGASAEATHHDIHGHPVHLDIRAPGVPAAAILDMLGGFAHGEEISTVRVIVTSSDEIQRECGAGNEACYRWGSGAPRIILPALDPRALRPILLHEYAHHIDASSVVERGAEHFDGTPRWFRARGMPALIASRQVAWMYDAGWERAVGEVFAEDYTVLHDPTGRHRIGHLGRPSRAVLAALAADLGTVTPVTIAAERPEGAVSRMRPPVRRGVLRAGRGRALATLKVRPGGRLRVVGRLSGARRGRALLRIRCNGRTVRTLHTRSRALRVDRALPAGRCRIVLRARRAPIRFGLRVSIG